MSVSTAQVIMIGDRYFCRFGKNGRVMTAWSLAGAELFLPDGRIKPVVEKIQSKGKKTVILSVGVSV